MRGVLVNVSRSASFYPISCLYLGAVVVIMLIARGLLSLGAGLILLACLAILALLAATWRELRTVHKMMDGQRLEMLARIDHMTELLAEHGISAPTPGPEEQAAREQARKASEEGPPV
jgi:hypothetical protein